MNENAYMTFVAMEEEIRRHLTKTSALGSGQDREELLPLDGDTWRQLVWCPVCSEPVSLVVGTVAQGP